MKWLTISQIKRRSKTAQGALKVSYKHWNQFYMATAKELRAEFKRTAECLATVDYCGLCWFYKKEDDCGGCVFEDYFDLWSTANSELIDWYNKDEGDWHAWKRASKAVRDKLRELMEKYE